MAGIVPVLPERTEYELARCPLGFASGTCCPATRLNLSAAIRRAVPRVYLKGEVASSATAHVILMKNFPDSDTRSPPRSGVVTRAPIGARNDTAQPALTSGFGAVIEKEHDLQSAIERSFGQTGGEHSADLDRILHHQHSRLGANIALLEQRYEALPKPERFANWHDRGWPPAKGRDASDEAALLPELVAQHTGLLSDIEALIGCAPDGQRGELILTEVGRSHEEMAWMLTALLHDDESAQRMADDRRSEGPGGTDLAQDNWDNEGGPVSIAAPSS